MFFHVYRSKRRDPVKYGTQAVLPAHIGKDHFFFLIYQDDHIDQPVQAAYDKNDKGHPCKRTSYKIIKIMHVSPLIY
jgi:hypothetical protein